MCSQASRRRRASYLLSLAGGLSIALAVTGLPTETASALPLNEVATASTTEAPTQDMVRPDSVSAMVTARATGERVEDLSQRTEESQVFSNPDGTWTSESAPEPVRVQDGHGGWHGIDTTLVARDGGFAPAWAASDLVLSAGGDRTFAQLTAKGHHLGWRWTQDLPAPVVKGNTATYQGVAPGDGDLVVTATSTGFSYDVVLHQAPTAPVVLTSPVDTDGAQIEQTSADGVAISTAAGATVAAAPHPMMWDAQVDTDGEPVNVHSVATQVAATASGGRVSLSPDQGFLTDPATVYPVTVDPSFTTYTTGDMWLENVDNTSAMPGTEFLKAGSQDGGTHKFRTYLDFKDSDATGRWDGTHVTSATLRFWNYSSGSCAAGAVRASMVTEGWATSNLTWGHQPTVSGSLYDDYAAAHGATNCDPDDADFNVTKIVDAWAHGTANYGIRIKAVDETSTNTYREYRSVNYDVHPAWRPKLMVTYNRYPGTASGLTTTPVTTYAPVGGTSASYTNDTTPKFTARATDPDGGTVQLKFEVRASASPTAALLGTCTTGFVAAGSNASCSLGAALADDQTVAVRAKAYDGKDWAGGSLGDAAGWSGWSAVTIAAGKPQQPVIGCPGYANGSWTQTPPAADVTCTVTATGTGATAAAYIDTQLGDGTVTRTKVTQSTDPAVAQATVTVPKAPGGYQVTAWAESPTDVASDRSSFSLGYGNFAITTPTPDAQGTATLTTANTVTISAAGPPDTATTPTAALKWRIASSGQDATTGWTTDPNADLHVVKDPTSGNMGVTGIWDTSGLGQDAQGTKLDERVPVLLDVQICLAYTSGDACSWSASQVTVQRVPHAFGDGFPTADAGPGQVALWTGEFSTGATDVDVPGYTGDLSISRAYNTFDGPTSGATGVFGPGWTTQLDGPGAGEAGEQLVDSTLTDGTLALVDASGESLVYAPALPVARRSTTADRLTAGDYVPVTEDTTLSGVRLSVSGTGLDTLVKVTDPDGTETVFQAVTAPAANSAGVFAPASVTEPGQEGATTYTADAAGRVTRVLAPVPPGVSCPDSGALNPGCRALDLSYDTTGHLIKVEFDHPGTGTTDLTTVATYTYDGTGRLVSATDSSQLTTSYDYDSQGRLSSLTPPGQATFHLFYAGAGSGKLQRITRDAPVDGGAVSTLATVVYDVPTTGADGAPSLTQADVDAWSQPAAPTYAAAVFGMNDQSVDPANVTAADWQYATLWYTDARGYTLNTASYGAGRWLLTDTEYDDRGNPVRELDTGDIAAIQDGQILPADAGTLTSYAPVKQTNTDGTTTTTVPAGALPSDAYAPARQVVLADGSTDWVRPHTHTDYDQGAPNGGINPDTHTGYGLPTTTTTTPWHVGTGTDLTGANTLAVTQTGYDPVVAGDPSGWNLGLPTTTTVVMPDRADITTSTRYDADGRVIETRQPKSNGADAGTRQTSYYTAGTDDAACQHTAWAGAVCKASYAGPAASGPLPTTRATGYNQWLEPTTVTDTVGGAVERATHLDYDDAGRPTKTWTTSSVAGPTPAPGTAITYGPASGLPTKQQATDNTGALTAGTEITTDYDKWARQTAYTPAPGETTTTSYNAAGNVAQVVDPKGTTTYSYDGEGTGGLDAAGKVEHRGLPTSMTISNPNGPALSFTGAYDPSGTLVDQTMPGGITQRVATDAAGQVTDESYSGQTSSINDDGTSTVDPDGVWVAWSRAYDAAGRVAQEWTPDGAAFGATLTTGTGSGYSRAYGYDRAGRLVHVEDHTIPAGAGAGATVDGSTGSLPAGTTCQTRDYGFDANGNRTSLTRTGANADGSCATTGGTTTSWSYDTADRLTGGYTYDALGRATTIPATDTPAVDGGNTTAGNLQLGYYDTDAIHTITQAGQTTTYTLDATGRRATSTTGPTGGTTTSTTARHYTDDTDNPGWTQTTTGGTTTTTRYAESLGGDLGLTVDAATGDAGIDVVNPHGDIVTSIDIPTGTSPATGIGAWENTDEYGNPQTPTATGATPTSATGLNYGWLGGKQRATDNTGLLLMGARAYNPVCGGFTSPDPVFGGNTTAYAYPQDPTNRGDATGLSDLAMPGGVGVGIPIGAIVGAGAGAAAITYFVKNWKYLATHVLSVPLPNVNSRRSRQDFKRYAVYRIVYRYLGRWHVYKYGITGQGDQFARPRSQVPTCEVHMGTKCTFGFVYRNVNGWYKARLAEAFLIARYAWHHGTCPPGQFWSCR